MADNTDPVFEYEGAFGDQYMLKPHIGMYADNDNLCVSFHYLDKDDGRWYPFCYATVNTISLAYLEATIDVNNNGMKMLDFLEKNGFGERTPYGVRSGFCTYPIFKFNEAMIKRIDPKVFADYAKTFGYDVSSLDDKIASAESKQQAPKKENIKEQER